MSKNPLHSEQKMNVAAAQRMVTDLVQRESRGPGDFENAMRRVEAKYGIPYSTLWGLRYRPPKDILLGIYNKIRSAYQAECARQARLLEHELIITKAMDDELDQALIEEIEALVEKVRQKHSGK